MGKYYLAYEERYKKVHSEGLFWFKNQPTPEVLEWIECNKIKLSDEICEVGCGEGRDALYLAQQGYKITALDVSKTVIGKCMQLASQGGVNVNFLVADILSKERIFEKKFKWIYSIATLHMLVEDSDREQFLHSIYTMLQPGGKFLLLSMGDGQTERKSDTSTAFELQERTHGETGRSIIVAGTSYRAVSWENHKQEIENSGFLIQKTMDTENDEYGKCMTVYLERE